MTREQLLKAALLEDEHSISAGGPPYRLTREEAERRRSEKLNVRPELIGAFRDYCRHRGMDEVTTLETVIGEWLRSQGAMSLAG